MLLRGCLLLLLLPLRCRARHALCTRRAIAAVLSRQVHAAPAARNWANSHIKVGHPRCDGGLQHIAVAAALEGPRCVNHKVCAAQSCGQGGW